MCDALRNDGSESVADMAPGQASSAALQGEMGGWRIIGIAQVSRAQARRWSAWRMQYVGEAAGPKAVCGVEEAREQGSSSRGSRELLKLPVVAEASMGELLPTQVAEAGSTLSRGTPHIIFAHDGDTHL